MILIRTHKFGHKLPKIDGEAFAINKKNRNALWQGANQNEMESVKVTFQTKPKGEKLQRVLVCQ